MRSKRWIAAMVCLCFVGCDAPGVEVESVTQATHVDGGPYLPPVLPIHPILECIVDHGNGTFTAHFGYDNENVWSSNVPIGTDNHVQPTPQDRGQPTDFVPGPTPAFPATAFQVAFTTGQSLVWHLLGEQSAAASSSATKCPDTQPPTAPTNLRSPRRSHVSADLVWGASTDNSGVGSYEIYAGSSLVATTNSATTAVTISGLTASTAYTFTVHARDTVGNLSAPSNAVTLTTDPTPPSAPETIAPDLDLTVPTDFAQATDFFFAEPNPIQDGVVLSAMVPQRRALLRGTVRYRDGVPVVAAHVSIVGQPALGYTLSRVDGRFDLLVNGGEAVTVSVSKLGFLESQRSVYVDWQSTEAVPDVVLVPLDEQVTVLSPETASNVEVARGSVVSDADGTRQATLMFEPSTEVTMIVGGVPQALDSISVRATEFTVGDTGLDAMPGTLPPTSGYTYAAEFSIDEALAAGATSVEFSKPVSVYLDNFLDFEVGGAVPAGYYDREQARWIPSENGRVWI